jgi:hypothetical protein
LLADRVDILTGTEVAEHSRHSPEPPLDMIYCPLCALPVADHTASGRTDGVCPKCRYRYGFLTGRVTHRFAKQITVRRPKGGESGRFRWAYEFRLDRADGVSEIVQFHISGDEDRINLQLGDSATVGYAMKGDTMDRIVSVVNDSTLTSFTVARPGSNARAVAIMLSVATAGGVFAVSAAQLAATLSASLFLAVIAGVPSFFIFDRLVSSRVPKGDPRAIRALRNAEFFSKKEALLALQTEHRRSSNRNAELRTRLVSLTGKMRSVGDELYATRMKQAQEAIDLLDRLIELDAATLDQYAKSITMIEIEQESLSVSEAMTDETAGVIAERMATLDEVQRQNAELQRLLEANEEVQRLLA